MRNATQTPNYNDEVSKAYFKILKQTKALLATIEYEELRFTLAYSEGREPGFNVKVDEFVNPLCYLCLVYADGENLEIRFGFEAFSNGNGFGAIVSQFIRILYKLTSVEHTALNIEGCICCEDIHTNCSDLYEYLEDSKIKRHKFVQIPFKAKPKRKLRKVA